MLIILVLILLGMHQLRLSLTILQICNRYLFLILRLPDHMRRFRKRLLRFLRSQRLLLALRHILIVRLGRLLLLNSDRVVPRLAHLLVLLLHNLLLFVITDTLRLKRRALLVVFSILLLFEIHGEGHVRLILRHLEGAFLFVIVS